MNNWHMGEKCEATESRGKDGEHIVLSEYYLGDESGYEEHEVKMELGPQGLSLSDQRIDGGFVFLYPKQIAHLRRLLAGGERKRPKPRP